MTKTLPDGQRVKVERCGIFWKWSIRSPNGEVVRTHSGYPTEHAAYLGLNRAVEGLIPGYNAGRADR